MGVISDWPSVVPGDRSHGRRKYLKRNKVVNPKRGKETNGYILKYKRRQNEDVVEDIYSWDLMGDVNFSDTKTKNWKKSNVEILNPSTTSSETYRTNLDLEDTFIIGNLSIGTNYSG